MTNCKRNYNASINLTVDEQLFSTKARCKFTQYMPSKPGKFGIKFWILSDAVHPYVLNARPYLGAHFEEDRQSMQLGQFVVMDLMKPFYNRGHNVTVDNFFTSKMLCESLKKQKTTLVGTVRGNRKELPREFTDLKRPLNSVLQGYHSGLKTVSFFQA